MCRPASSLQNYEKQSFVGKPRRLWYCYSGRTDEGSPLGQASRRLAEPDADPWSAVRRFQLPRRQTTLRVPCRVLWPPSLSPRPTSSEGLWSRQSIPLPSEGRLCPFAFWQPQPVNKQALNGPPPGAVHVAPVTKRSCSPIHLRKRLSSSAQK